MTFWSLGTGEPSYMTLGRLLTCGIVSSIVIDVSVEDVDMTASYADHIEEALSEHLPGSAIQVRTQYICK